MTIRLYLETNFLLSHAYGRDPATSRLVASQLDTLQIAIPPCCVMEALTHLQGERKRINRLVGDQKAWIHQLRRSGVSPHAVRLVEILLTLEPEWRANIQFFEERLREVIAWVADPARVACLVTRPADLNLLHLAPDQRDATDQLILHTILADAREHPTPSKVLLTENRRCFHDNPSVRQVLAAAGIRYFALATNFLQWYEAGAELK